MTMLQLSDGEGRDDLYAAIAFSYRGSFIVRECAQKSDMAD